MKEWMTDAIAATFLLALGLWTKFSFVHRKELYGKDSRPIFAYRADCEHDRAACNASILREIAELKSGQEKVWNKLDELNKWVGRVDQYMRNGRH